MSKRELLRELAQARKRARWEGYRCIGDYHRGAYECDEVSPYSKTAGNVDSSIFVMLQDWNSDDRLQEFDSDAKEFGYTRSLPTNKTLTKLLHQVFSRRLEDIYATNLFPFIKMGGISAPIPMTVLLRAAHEFALPQIRIVQPALVICLGLNTYKAIRRACNGSVRVNMAEAISSPFKYETATIWCQAHTGSRGVSNRGGYQRVLADWLRMSHRVLDGA